MKWPTICHLDLTLPFFYGNVWEFMGWYGTTLATPLLIPSHTFSYPLILSQYFSLLTKKQQKPCPLSFDRGMAFVVALYSLIYIHIFIAANLPHRTTPPDDRTTLSYSNANPAPLHAFSAPRLPCGSTLSPQPQILTLSHL